MIHLLWTGGWDSTFRLLQILLEEKRAVQTHYIIDQRRVSRTKEIETQHEIRKWILDQYPHTRQLFLDTKYFTLEDILPDENLTNVYQNIIKRRHLGDQYEWLSRYCKQKGIQEMELSKEKFTTTAYDIEIVQFLYSEYTQEYKSEPYFDELSKNFRILFRYFTLPIMHLSKKDMLAISKQKNWYPALEKTWFCFYPVNNKTPCGLCKPCSLVIRDDFSWRIPLHRRLYRECKLMYRYLKRTLRQQHVS